MSRFLFFATAVFVGVVGAGVIGHYADAPDPYAWPQPWTAAQPLPLESPTDPPPELPMTFPAAQPTLQPAPQADRGTPIGIYAVAGAALLIAGAGAGVAVRRRRRDEPTAEIDLQEHWLVTLTASTSDGVRHELRRGLLHWPALNAAAVEAEVIARHEGAYGRPDGTTLMCQAVPASQWAIYAGAKIVARGPVDLDGATPEGVAVELLDEYAQRNRLGLDEIRRLRCALWGPDGYGEADGRDW